MAPDAADLAIYSEAICTDAPYYQGSEDEDYPDPQTRRRRYEEAGRRFLDGKVPFLLSASLRGPFDKESGWTNPWRSRQRCQSSRASQVVCESVQRVTAKLPHEQESAPDDLDCHLPSPESLKQDPTSAPSHPYLEQDELAMVQNWRESIHVPSLSQDSFWASNSHTSLSTTKRKAKESAWLRRIAAKKRRTHPSDESPLFSSQPEHESSPIARNRASLPPRGRTSSRGPNHGIGSAIDSLAAQQSQMEREASDNDEDDDLTRNTPDSAFASGSRYSGPCKKQQSPRKHALVKATADELSQREGAAATLSSPVSQRHGPTQASKVSTGEVPIVPAMSIKRPPKPSWQGMGDEAKEASLVTDENEQQNDELTMALDEDSAPFQTQQDQSFCFKMRCALAGDSAHEAASQVLPNEPSQAASPTENSWQQQSRDAQAAEGRSSQDTPEHDPLEVEIDACDNDETKSISTSEDTDETEAQPQEKRPEGGSQEVACPTISRLELQVMRRDIRAVADVAQQAISTVFPAQTDLGCSLPATQSTEEAQTPAEPRQGDTTPPSASVCSEATSECGDVDIHPSTVQRERTPAITVEHETLAPADLQQGGSADPSLEAGLTSCPSPIAQEADVASPVEPQPSPHDPVVFAESSDYAMEARPRSPAEEVRGDFSIRNILYKLAPLSPWSRSPRPELRPEPSPVPQPEIYATVDSAPHSARPEGVHSRTSDMPWHGVGDVDGLMSRPSAPAETEEPALPDTLVESAAANAPSEQGPVADDEAAHQGMATSRSDPDERVNETWIAASQQSPWARAGPSQREDQNVGATPGHDRRSSPLFSSHSDAAPRVPPKPEAQSPWSREAELAATAASSTGAAEIVDGCEGKAGDALSSQLRHQPQPSTPEPQFVVKTFTSFLSPSPRRSLGRKERPSARSGESGGPPSALKNPWSRSRPSRRVSWASMPPDRELARVEPGTQAVEPTPRSRLRQASPPPATPMDALPVSEASRFGKHFAAVAGRTDGLRQKLIPTASQQALQSPGMQGMAKTFLAADEIAPGGAAAAIETIPEPGCDASSNDQHEADGASEGSEEPMGLVEDMLREMADFVKAWDVDAELDGARKAARPEARQLSAASQSPW